MRTSIARLIAALGLLIGALALGTPASAATVSVANCNDSGSGSLRAAIGNAAAGATITFATDCPASGPIRLTGGSLTLSQGVTIDGTGRHIVIDGNCTTDANSDCTGGGNTVFHVTGGTVTFNALTIQHGNTPTSFGGGPPGGGILNDFGRVTVANSTITRNHAAGEGGGIANNDDHNLTVTNSTIANNSALGGGGIDTGYNETVTITNSTISNNSSSLSGGGIYGGGGTLNVSNSLIVNNTGYHDMADDEGGSSDPTSTDINNLTGAFAFANGETTPQDHGGPTRTLAIPTPAAPAGTDAYQGGNLAACQRISPAYDQRGAARVVAGKCSIGAFEPGLVNTATTLTANATSVAVGSSVTFTASVSGVRGGTPPDSTGSVTFASNGAPLGTVNLAGGKATFTTSSLSPGNSVTATYAAGGTGNPYGASPASNAVSVTIIPLDSSPPATTATLAGTAGSNGWYTSAVTVTLAATDPDGAADVASTTYSVDGGAAQPYTAPFIVSGDGTHTVTFSSTDKAGNAETTKTQAIKIDATAPTAIVGTPGRGPDAGGYYNHSVAVTFAGQDATSGIATCTTGAAYSGPDSATATVPGNCTDTAGNSASGSFALKYDATKPVTTATPDRAAIANGWYNAPVKVTLSATDTLAGVAKSQYNLDNAGWTDYVPGTPVTVAGDGSHTVLYYSVDNAGNREADGTLTIKIDATAPTFTSANAAAFAVGTAGTFTVTTNGYPAVATITEAGSLPGGVTFTDNGNGTATLSGTPAAGSGGTYPLTLTASNDVAPNATQPFTLTVNQPPAITSATGATFTVGTAGTFTVTTSGFPFPAITEAGALPGGVTLADNGNGTATLAGTAMVSGPFPLTITANNGVAPNATQSFNLTVDPGPASTLTPSPSTPQSATVTTAFPTLSVSVKDAGNNPVADGTPVAFTATPAGNGAGATFSNGGGATTTGGVATITATANAIAGGPYTVTATSNGHAATFALTNTPGAPASIAASAGTPQHAPVGATFVTALAATVTDSGGNPVGAGVGVTFTVVPAGGAGASFPGNATSATATTNASGVATAPGLTADTVAGAYTVTANVSPALATPASFALANLPGAAATLAVTAYPASVVAGTAHPFTVTALDQYGNTATGHTGTVRFTSTDSHAALPADYPFVAGDAGAHTFSASFGSAGTWSLTATDTATAAIAGTEGGIAVGAVATTTSLAISPSPAAHGGPVTLAATVAPATATGLPAPVGTVAFAASGTPLATVALVGGTATFSTSGLTVGMHHLTATYNPTVPGPYATSQGAQDETITPSALVSIAVTPATATLNVGQQQQFAATGTYADSSTADLTSQVTWSSDASNIVSIDTTGKGTAKVAGTAHLMATQGGVSGQATVTVTPPVLTGVQSAPAPTSRPSGASVSGTTTPAPAPVPSSPPTTGVSAPVAAPTGR